MFHFHSPTVKSSVFKALQRKSQVQKYLFLSQIEALDPRISEKDWRHPVCQASCSPGSNPSRSPNRGYEDTLREETLV